MKRSLSSAIVGGFLENEIKDSKIPQLEESEDEANDGQLRSLPPPCCTQTPFYVQDKTGFHYYHFDRQDPHSTACRPGDSASSFMGLYRKLVHDII